MTRRGLALMLGTIAARLARAQRSEPGTTIHQEIDFNAPPARIYSALLDAKQFAEFTNHPAEMEPRPGGTFKLFGGRIEGRNIELVSNQRIVQAWRPSSWQAGVYRL